MARKPFEFGSAWERDDRTGTHRSAEEPSHDATATSMALHLVPKRRILTCPVNSGPFTRQPIRVLDTDGAHGNRRRGQEEPPPECGCFLQVEGSARRIAFCSSLMQPMVSAELLQHCPTRDSGLKGGCTNVVHNSSSHCSTDLAGSSLSSWPSASSASTSPGSSRCSRNSSAPTPMRHRRSPSLLVSRQRG